MNILRRSALVGAASFLSFLLFSLAAIVGILQVAGSSEPVKETLAESGIYNSVVSGALDEAKKSENTGSEVSLTDPVIKKAAEESFTPQTIQDSTEKVIDGIYAWLDGETPEPSFNIDLSNAKTSFAQKVGQAATEKASTLPACSANYIPPSNDPFSATCLPRGVTAAQIGTEAEQNIIRGEGFLEKPVITADNFKNENSNSTLFNEQLKSLPENYQRLKSAPIILTILALLMAAAIIFFSVSKRKGIRKVGIILLTTGVVMLVFAWAFNWAVKEKVVPEIKLENKVLETRLQTLTTNLANDIDKNYWVFGGVYSALGVLAVAGTMFIGRSGKPPKLLSDTESDAAPPIPPKEAAKAQYKDPTRPAKKKVLVQ